VCRPLEGICLAFQKHTPLFSCPFIYHPQHRPCFPLAFRPQKTLAPLISVLLPTRAAVRAAVGLEKPSIFGSSDLASH
jgi:hypothetical protein